MSTPAAYGDDTNIKSRSGVDDDDVDATPEEFDQLVTNLNQAASGVVEGYCQRDFQHHEGDTVKIDGNGRRSIRLPNHPVIEISEVKLGGTVLDADEYRVKPNPSRPDLNAGILEKKSGVWRQPSSRDWENLEVTYDWGFTSPPQAVVDVVEDLVVRELQASLRNVRLKGAATMSVEGFSIGFGAAEERLPFLTDGHKTQLDPYKLVVVV